MNKETLESFNQLGEKLEKVGSHGYEILIKHTVMQGIFDLISIIAILIVTIISWIVLYKSYKKCVKCNVSMLFEKDYNSNVDPTYLGYIALIVSGFLTLLLLGAVILGVPISIQEITNPEGYLIKETIDNLK